MKQSNYSCGGYDFQFSIYLQMNITYILVITTFQPNIRGEFSVFVYGSNNVTLNRISKYDYTTMMKEKKNCTMIYYIYFIFS